MEEVKDQLTLVEMIYHREHGEEPQMVEHRWSRKLKTKEQFYQRRCRATEEPQLLDYGWIACPSMIIISNEEGRNLQRVPDPEQQQEIGGRIIEVLTTPGLSGWLIYPGESFRATPADPDQVRVRCLQGTAKFTLSAIPE